MARSFWQRVIGQLRRLFSRSPWAIEPDDGDETSPPSVAETASDPQPASTAAAVDTATSEETPSPSAEPPSPSAESPAPPSPAPRSVGRQPSPVSTSNGAAIFGVDFGTTFTSLALVLDGRLSVVQDEQQRQPVFPSVVCYPERDKALVGWDARAEGPKHPQLTFTSPKRLIGRRFDDRQVEPALAALSVPTRAGPDGHVVADVHGDTLAMPQVCAEIFRHAATLGERATGKAVRRVVLSVPVAFSTERKAIERAVRLAGLEVLSMIDEPVAAAIGYGFGRHAGLVGVYDFGGGTFDCTLLEVREGQFRILGKGGDAWLGGDDFDLALAEHAARAFWRQHRIDLHQRRVEWHRLVLACEAAKRRLSEEPVVELSVPQLVNTSGGALDLRLELNREMLSQLCGPLVDRSIEVMASCFQQAGVKPEQIGYVAMTGGVSCMPLVRERVRNYFGTDVARAVNPLLAVVAGNAIYGHFLTSKPGASPATPNGSPLTAEGQ